MTNCTTYSSAASEGEVGDSEKNDLGAFLYCLVLILIYVVILGFLFFKYMRQRSSESTEIARYQLYMVASDFKRKLVLNEMKARMMQRMSTSIPYLFESNQPLHDMRIDYQTPHHLPDVMEEETISML